ncbi:hypothetical protein D3C80_1616220 [compost metagenome]
MDLGSRFHQRAIDASIKHDLSVFFCIHNAGCRFTQDGRISIRRIIVASDKHPLSYGHEVDMVPFVRQRHDRPEDFSIL